MPRLTIHQSNMTGGEISPRMYGRTDIPNYATYLRKLTNAYPVVHGGAKRRPGTKFYKETKDSSKLNRMIPFVFSRDAAYMLEFGDLYVRVHKAGGVDLGVELVTPYTQAMLAEIDFAQGADTMFIFHPLVPVQRMRRFTDAYFDLSPAPFVTTPFDEQGHAPATTLTLSASTVGAGRSATAGSASFLVSDVGRNIISQAGLGVITGYTSSTVVTITIVIAFPGLVLASGAWSLDVSPQSAITPSAVGPIGTAITLTSPDDTWRAEDAGKFVKINGGLVELTTLSTVKVFNGIVRQVLSSAFAAPADSWTLNSTVWSAANGYPRTGTLHEQRLVLAGNTKYPQTIWGSKPGEYLDFTIGTADDDAYSFTIAADEINPISYVTSLGVLVAHTYGGEFSLQGGVEKPLTPTNVRIRPESPHGCQGVRPLLVGRESIFVQRSGKKLRSLGFNAEVDGYKSPDITVLAEHITAPGTITALSFQQEPDLLIWAVRADGALLSCTFDRDQAVVAWAPHYTEGAFESVATIPNGDIDETWVSVRRTAGGATKRFVEIFNDSFEPIYTAAPDPLAFPPATAPVVYGYTVDCGAEVSNPAGQTTITLAHLVGEEVDLVADGLVMPVQTVPPGGVVTLTRTAKRILGGLHFRNEIGLLTPEVGTGEGTAQGNSMRTSEVTVRLLNTLGCEVFDGNDRRIAELSFKKFGADVLDQAPEPFTGLKRAEKLGWERGIDELTIVQDQPLPMHVLSVIRKFQVNPG